MMGKIKDALVVVIEIYHLSMRCYLMLKLVVRQMNESSRIVACIACLYGVVCVEQLQLLSSDTD